MKQIISAITLVLLSASFQANAQGAEKIQLLIRESMVNNSDVSRIELAWVLTDDFWEYCIYANPETAGEDIADEFYEVVTEYNIIAVVVGKQSGGGVTFAGEKEMRKTLSLTGQDGKKYTPLNENSLSDKLRMTLDIFRPIFGQFLGEFGANFQLFVFEKENKIGELIFDPTQEEDVTIQTLGTSFTWNLPMSSLIPEKRCPEDGELMNGTWNYCPIHGKPLEVVEE